MPKKAAQKNPPESAPPDRKKRIIAAFLIFAAVYPLCLVVWISLVKPTFGLVVGETGTYLAAATFQTRLETFEKGEEVLDIVHAKPLITDEGLADTVIQLKLYISNFSFNLPLTLAIMIALLPLFRWRPLHLCEAIGLIVLVHLLFVYFFNAAHIYGYLAQMKAIEPSVVKAVFWEFSWTFIDNLVIRFEPFLVIVYLWLRERKRLLKPDPVPVKRRTRRR